jgi:hypothetical protein
MPGLFKITYNSGITKLINLRNVCAVSLQSRQITFQYNFPCVTGENFYARVESWPAYEMLEMPTEEAAEKEFEAIRKEFERLE